MQDLVPRRCTGQQNLDCNTNDVHVAEAASENWQSSRSCKNEQNDRTDKRRGEMDDTIGDPGQYIQESVGVSRQNITQIGAVDDILKSG